MKESFYWDYFKERIIETVSCLKYGIVIPIRRVAIFVTNKCNLNCGYCNFAKNKNYMSEHLFNEIVSLYQDPVIFHITGGEPSTVPWLYSYIENNGTKRHFNINTNLLIPAPYKYLHRVKTSLDSNKPDKFNKLVGSKDAFDKITKNISIAQYKTDVSVTCTITLDNIFSTIDFVDYINKNFKNIYAVTFSIYKGRDPKFVITKEVATEFFDNVVPELKRHLKDESLLLFNDVMDKPSQLINGIRFPEIKSDICYLSLSERTYDIYGNISNCSHLYRDNVKQDGNNVMDRCYYGCSKKLVRFNNEVYKQIKERIPNQKK